MVAFKVLAFSQLEVLLSFKVASGTDQRLWTWYVVVLCHAFECLVPDGHCSPLVLGCLSLLEVSAVTPTHSNVKVVFAFF